MLNPVELLSELVTIPSVNPMGRPSDRSEPPEAKLTAYLETLLIRLGLAVARQAAEPGRDNLLALLPGKPNDKERPRILFEAHQDTVPVDGMTVSPFAAEIRDGRLYGRGACDVKGGMAAMLAAVARMAVEQPEKMPSVLVALTVNEEYGFTGAKALTGLWKDEGPSEHGLRAAVAPGRPEAAEILGPLATAFRRKPDYAIVAEPTELQVVVAHKGVVRWRCRARGKAAHSASPSAGENAIYRMGRALVAIERYAREVVGGLGTHRLCGSATISVGTISGGVSVNTVPDACTIEIDRRLMPDERPEAARQHLVAYLERETGLGAALVHESPFLVAAGLSDHRNGPLAKRLIATTKQTGVACQAMGVPYATDAAAFDAAGIPTVVFGPGSIAQAHTADEWITLDQVQKAAEIYYRFLKSFC